MAMAVKLWTADGLAAELGHTAPAFGPTSAAAQGLTEAAIEKPIFSRKRRQSARKPTFRRGYANVRVVPTADLQVSPLSALFSISP